jgi:anti-anti-sigma factor
MTVRAMPRVSAEKSARAGCVVVALRGELDVCAAADGLSALDALPSAGASIVVDLAELAFMDCHSLNKIMAVRAQARRAGGAAVSLARSWIVSSALFRGAAVRHVRVLTGLITAASRKWHDGAGTHQDRPAARRMP